MEKKKKDCYNYIAASVIVLLLVLVCLLFLRLRGSVYVKSTSDVEPEAVFFFDQKDPAWSEQHLGDSRFTIRTSGCLTTSIASVLNMESLTIEGLKEIDPGTLNQFLGEKQVYDGEGNIEWEPLERVLGVSVVRKDASDVGSDGLQELLSQNIFPIVRVRMKGLGNFHYVVIVKSEGGKFWCMDTLNKKKEMVPLTEFGNRIYAVRYLELKSEN